MLRAVASCPTCAFWSIRRELSRANKMVEADIQQVRDSVGPVQPKSDLPDAKVSIAKAQCLMCSHCLPTSHLVHKQQLVVDVYAAHASYGKHCQHQ